MPNYFTPNSFYRYVVCALERAAGRRRPFTLPRSSLYSILCTVFPSHASATAARRRTPPLPLAVARRRRFLCHRATAARLCCLSPPPPFAFAPAAGTPLPSLAATCFAAARCLRRCTPLVPHVAAVAHHRQRETLIPHAARRRRRLPSCAEWRMRKRRPCSSGGRVQPCGLRAPPHLKASLSSNQRAASSLRVSRVRKITE